MYYDLSDIGQTKKEMAMAIIAIVVILALCFSAGYLLGVKRAGDVPDNGDGTANIREQLGTAAVNQREITEGITGAESGAARIEGGIQQVSTSAELVEAGVAEAGRLIDECQQIIGTVRNRRKAEKAKD